ncbi:D-glycero-beta-D-manno-heptose 1-phosphate adenylyltransferase [Candidatus Magnetomoraceae bacterium gMMP-15]
MFKKLQNQNLKIILDRASLKEKISILKNQGKRIVFTNGCFDILHAGHVRYLTEACNQGDVLIVGLNSDSSVKTIKGPKRPIISQNERAEVLAALSCVDYVTVFYEPDPFELISALMPDVLIKGSDWAENDIIGGDVVKAAGGEVIRVELVPGISTTEIIRRIGESSA